LTIAFSYLHYSSNIPFSDDHSVTNKCQNSSFYLLEWLLPRLSFSDKIVVKDVRALYLRGDLGFWTTFFAGKSKMIESIVTFL
jgi:hypothetical protein